MLSYVYNEDRQLVLTERPAPHMGQGGAVMKVAACSICGTDVRTYNLGSSRIQQGRVIGHEAVGVITEISPGISHFSVGDAVAVAPAIGCGNCVSCRKGFTNMCDELATIGYQYDGGFAEYMEIPAQAFAMGNVNKLPETGDLAQYTLAEPLACTINAHTYLKIGQGDDVVIFGAGYIGCMHAELSALYGAAHIAIVEVSPQRRQEALAHLPGIRVFSPEEAPEGVLAMTGGKGADVAIVACSAGPAQASALSMLAKRGRLSLFGGLAGESSGFLDSNAIHYKELGVYGVHASTPGQNRQAIELIRDGKIRVDKYISRRYPLRDIERAFADINAGEVLKAIVTFE